MGTNEPAAPRGLTKRGAADSFATWEELIPGPTHREGVQRLWFPPRIADAQFVESLDLVDPGARFALDTGHVPAGRCWRVARTTVGTSRGTTPMSNTPSGGTNSVPGGSNPRHCQSTGAAAY